MHLDKIKLNLPDYIKNQFKFNHTYFLKPSSGMQGKYEGLGNGLQRYAFTDRNRGSEECSEEDSRHEKNDARKFDERTEGG